MNRACLSTPSIKRVALGLVLSQMFMLQAASSTGVAEAAAALSSVPFKMAARHCAYKNSVKAAAVLNLTADTITLCRDVLYFWNQSQDNGHRRDELFTDTWGYTAVNGAMAIRDLTKWGQHLGECMGLKSAIDIAVDDEVVDFGDEVVATSQAAAGTSEDQSQGEQKISKLAYAWQVIALPSLEGLSAFAVAVTQQSSTNWCSPEREAPFRQIATAAHAFVRLLDERTMLEQGSKNTKALDALLMVSAIWLAYEIITYSQLPDPVVPVVHGEVKAADNGGGKEPVAGATAAGTKAAATTAGTKASAPAPIVRVNDTSTACSICMTDFDAHNRVALDACGHAFCRDCLRHLVDDSEKAHDLAMVRCPFVGCGNHMNDADLRGVVDDPTARTRIMKGYDDAMFDRAAILIPNMRHCPTANCKYQYYVSEHVTEADRVPLTCPLCKNDFCANCLQATHVPEQACQAPVLGSATVSNGTSAEDKASIDVIMRGSVGCPSCHRRIFRFDGCNHMTCICKHQFCYRCLAPYNGGFTCRCGYFDAETNKGGERRELAPALETKGAQKTPAQTSNNTPVPQSRVATNRPVVVFRR